MFEGRVEAIQIAAAAEAAVQSVGEVRAVEGAGLEGDRYFDKDGTFSKKEKPGRALTLVEAEAIEAAARDYDVPVTAPDTRRNVVVRGVSLNHLVGREFRVGELLLRGIELCEPCGHMEKLCGKEGARKALIHRGGLRADILRGGTLRVGDSVGPA